MRCPFPDCPTQESIQTSPPEMRVEHVADDVYLCRTCGRLVFQCIAEDCQALNRPFSRFCRRCGEPQHPETGSTAMKRWEEVQRFDFDWMFPIARKAGERDSTPSHAQPVASSLVLDLEKIKGFRPPKVLIEWAFVDGLLAVHQGGGFLALVHPFGDLAENPHGSAIIWTRPEEGLLRQHDSGLPYVSEGQAEVFRPFVPIATTDRKYAIFSTPYAVFAVELGSLPGWHYRAETRATVLWSAEPSLKTWLAASPVLLTRPVAPSRRYSRHSVEPIPNRIGLLLVDSQQRYSWHVVPLDEAPLEGGVTEASESERSNTDSPLPIHGNRVQILGFRDQHLVFATPAGHWLWSCEAARRGDVSTMLSLPANVGETGDIVLDEEVQTRSVFSWRNQHLLRKHDHDGTPQRDEPTRQYFELCYARFRHGRYAVERRSVWPGDPDGTRRAVPQPVPFHDRAARPLGDCVSIDDSSAREMLFLVDSAGELYRRPITGDDPRPLGNIQTGRLTEIYGFRFYDPLLVVVCKDASHDALQQVELRSLRHPDTRAIAAGLSLKADPLPWSNFLFTCEETDDGIAVVRREYSVVRTGVRHKTEPRVFESRKAHIG